MRWDLSATNLSQKELARLLKVEKSHFSRFLSGKVGLSAETTLKLLQLMNLSPRSLALKFGQPEVTRARLMHLQESGREMKLSNDGGGWVSKEGDSAADPNNRGDDITNTWKANGAPSDDELIDVLRQVDNIHKQAREAIANWFANNQKSEA